MTNRRVWPAVLGLMAVVSPWCASTSFAIRDWHYSKDAPPKTREQAERIKWWREARFGMFICWGPVSVKGTEGAWSRAGKRPCWDRGGWAKGTVPVEVYDNLYKQFNPTRFDAKQWLEIVKAAGARYVIFLAKHHDGFCMFDSRLTDYKITSPLSPFGRDVTAEVINACHEAGVPIILYYSQPDWHHPDFWTEHHDRYSKYLHGQLKELCTNYGRIDGIWWDGLLNKPESWDAENLEKMIREYQPHIIFNNRNGLTGDYDTPEQHIGMFQNDRDWESCITLGKAWCWKPNDKLKSPKECIRMLVRCAGGDGNLALATGPMPDGRIEPRQIERFTEIGSWLRRYGRSIYATSGGPFKPGTWGASTHADRDIYLHIFDWQGESLHLPAIDKKIAGSVLLTRGRLKVEQTDDGITVTVPKEYHQDIDTIAVLKLSGPAGQITPVEVTGRPTEPEPPVTGPGIPTQPNGPSAPQKKARQNQPG